MKLAGYAALFDVADAAGDVIRKGAFVATLKRTERLPLYWQHRPTQRIGWVESAAEDARGLQVVAAIDRQGSRAARLLEVGAVSGLSFGYRTREYRRLPKGRELLTLDAVP